MKSKKVKNFIINALAAAISLAVIGLVYGFACAALVALGVA